MREYSGGLSIHKSSHHFDLVNWWLEQTPVEAFAFGALNYYGANSDYNPENEDGRYCGTCTVSERCSYHSRWSSRSQRTAVQDDHIESNAGRHEGYTDYRPDQCVFDSEIEIEDTYTATIKYNKGALLSYSINFSLPYEGYRLAINGTKGELKRWSIMRHHECLSRLPNKRLTFFSVIWLKRNDTCRTAGRRPWRRGSDCTGRLISRRRSHSAVSNIVGE